MSQALIFENSDSESESSLKNQPSVRKRGRGGGFEWMKSDLFQSIEEAKLSLGAEYAQFKRVRSNFMRKSTNFSWKEFDTYVAFVDRMHVVELDGKDWQNSI